MLLKVLYFCLGIGFHATQALNGEFSQSQPMVKTQPSTTEINAPSQTLGGELPKNLPLCSEIQKTVASTPVQVGIDCIDGEVQKPNDVCVTSPNHPNVDIKPPEPAQTLDYRWENYNGTPPKDAFEIRYLGFPTKYIGQVEIPDAGKCIGVLEANQMEIEVSCNGHYEKTDNIKILCVGHKTYYAWNEIKGYSDEEFRAVVKDNEFVKAGYNEIKKIDTIVGAYDTAPKMACLHYVIFLMIFHRIFCYLGD